MFNSLASLLGPFLLSIMVGGETGAPPWGRHSAFTVKRHLKLTGGQHCSPQGASPRRACRTGSLANLNPSGGLLAGGRIQTRMDTLLV